MNSIQVPSYYLKTGCRYMESTGIRASSYYQWIIWEGTAREVAVAAAYITTTAHYCDVIMGAMASQITSLTIAYSTVHSGGDQRKHLRSASLAFVRVIHWWAAKSPHKWPVTRKMPFDDVIMSRCRKNFSPSATFIESCASTGWKDCDSVRLL